MKLRPYQEDAVAAVWDYFRRETGNPILALPTGTGKSLVAAKLVEGMVKAYPSTRILGLTHVKELISNNYDTLLRIWPTAPAGVYSAGLKRKDVFAPITFGGIASIRNKGLLFKNTDLVIIDECHLVSPNATTTYRRFIDELRQHRPTLKVIGLTATPYRLGLGTLLDGGLFTDIAYDITKGEDFITLIDAGYLAPLVPKKPSVQIDISDIGTRQGEFIPADVSREMQRQDLTRKAMAEAFAAASDRRHWLVFATSIEHVDEIVALLREKGMPAAGVHSKIPDRDRDAAIAAFKAGQVQALVNKDILTTGFDFPSIDCIVMLRPTKSPGLWVQMLGRGTRPAPGKHDCLVLDFAGNTERLGPINYPTLPTPSKKGAGTAPVRTCPECQTILHISIRQCPCGYEFPLPPKFTEFASTADLIAKREEPVYGIFAVDRVLATPHRKAGKPPAVRVDYHSGIRRFTTYVCPEHGGFATTQARRWWFIHGRDLGPMPSSAAELLARFSEVKAPYSIKVHLNRKYPDIVAYDTTGELFKHEQHLIQTPPKNPPADIPDDDTIIGRDRLGDLRDMF